MTLHLHLLYAMIDNTDWEHQNTQTYQYDSADEQKR